MVTNSRHFRVEQLADDVYGAIHIDGGWAVCNAGIIDLGDLTLVFDTFLTPRAAQELKVVAETLTGRSVGVVANSHFHNDHVWGNQSFGLNTHIVSSIRTRQLISTAGMEEFQWYAANSVQKLESLRRQVQLAEGAQKRSELSLWIGYYEGLVEALPHLSVRLPNITFENRFVIHGTRRSAELLTFENAHTGSDTVLWLPEDKIIFMSDLLFVGCHPHLGDGDPLKLSGTLEELSRTGATAFIPGHGPVGTLDDVELMASYIEHCHRTAAKLVEEGSTGAERLAAVEIPERYRQWQQPMFFQANLGVFCQLLNEEQVNKAWQSR